jgi:ABC-2 type transport system ATP-binding protein
VTTAVVQAYSLTKRFSKAQNYRALLRPLRREEILAVDGVSLQVEGGELFGLLGPNGAGKTTLVKMLSTLILPNAGRAAICGRDVVTQAQEVRSIVGLVDCQERSFFWRLTGRQNLRFFAALHGLYGARADARIDELLALVDLSAHADRRFMGYSTGMRQRLSIARGLLAAPPVVLMDEPTRSLDPVVARDLRAFIREKLVDGLGHTVLLVTHRLEEAEALCDRVAIMNHGRIVACGRVKEIKKMIPVRQRYELCVRGLPDPLLHGLREIPGVIEMQQEMAQGGLWDVSLIMREEQEVLPAVLSSIMSRGGEVLHCHNQGLSLEEAFVYLVREKGEDGT